MTAFYNEIDPYCAQWLRNLMGAGLIPEGVVDERDIRAIQPDELRGYDQVHLFAGIGGWAHACRLAGWPDDRPIWTGSCPCQPFSVAGRGAGEEDGRHLWPAFFGLIREVRPSLVVGEQVASKAALAWLDGVCDDMEGAGYAVRAADICAASVGAPHVRQRLWWVADSNGGRWPQGVKSPATLGSWHTAAADDLDGVWLANAAGAGLEGDGFGSCQAAGAGIPDQFDGRGESGPGYVIPGAPHGFWRDADWLSCRDGRWRPARPGSFPLAYGVPHRVAKLRAIGNAIVPQVAAEILGVVMEALDGVRS